MSVKCEVEVKEELLDCPGHKILEKTPTHQGNTHQRGVDPFEEIFIQENIKTEKSEEESESESQPLNNPSHNLNNETSKTYPNSIEAIYFPENIKEVPREGNGATDSEHLLDVGSEFGEKTKEWTQDQSLHLIEQYRNHELIWNSKHKYHTDPTFKQLSWKKIAQNLNRPVDECRKKMECLLSGFRKERMKLINSIGSGKVAEEIYKSKWFAYNSLSFLLDKNKPRGDLTTCVENDSNMPEYEDIASTSKAQIDMCFESVVSTQSRRKKGLEETQVDKEFHLLTASTNILNSDESQHFGDFIASKLRLYDDLTRSAIQNDIMAIFLKAHSGFYNQYYLPSSEKTSPYHVNKPVLPLYPQNQNSSPNSAFCSSNPPQSPSFRFHVPSPCNDLILSADVSSEDVNIPEFL